MADKEILITIRNEVVDSGGGSNNSRDSQVPMAITDGEIRTDSGMGDIGELIVTNAVKQASSFALSNYGNLTGDYQTQANLQGGIELYSLGRSALKGGPLGIAVALGSIAIRAVNYQMELNQKRLQTEALRMRTGMMNYNGGR